MLRWLAIILASLALSSCSFMHEIGTRSSAGVPEFYIAGGKEPRCIETIEVSVGSNRGFAESNQVVWRQNFVQEPCEATYPVRYGKKSPGNAETEYDWRQNVAASELEPGVIYTVSVVSPGNEGHGSFALLHGADGIGAYSINTADRSRRPRLDPGSAIVRPEVGSERQIRAQGRDDGA